MVKNQLDQLVGPLLGDSLPTRKRILVDQIMMKIKAKHLEISRRNN